MTNVSVGWPAIKPECDARKSQLHVLISSFACHPEKGSEPGIGWGWIQHISSHCRVSALVRAGNREVIERRLQQTPLPNVQFYYVEPPRFMQGWTSTHKGWYIYYTLWQLKALRQAKRILHDDPFDLAHHVTYSSLPMPIFLHRLGVPLVYGPVGGGERSPIHFWWGGGWRALAYECIRTLRLLSLRWDPFFHDRLHKAAQILVTTPETAAFIPDRFVDKTKVMLAIGIDQVDSPPVDAEKSGHHIYTAGRLLHWKGFHLAIRAFAKIADQYPDLTFTILGDGPQQRRLERLIRQLGLEGRVVLKGQTSRAEVLQTAFESDIFLFPSLHDSGGAAVFEAMVAGLPVICLQQGGPGVIVTPECGIAVRATTFTQTIDDLATALTRLMDDPALRQQMGQNSRQHMLDTYVWQEKAMQMLHIYQDVVFNAVSEDTSRVLT